MNTQDERVFDEVNDAGGDGTRQADLPQEAVRSTITGRVVILIVEDSNTQALLLRHLLEEHRCRVLIAENGQEALSLIRQQRPTLVITDINMPEMDGYQLCKTIKGDEELCDLPVILLTSLSDPKDVLTGIECGADSFVVKPYDGPLLLSRVDRLLTHLPRPKRTGMTAMTEVIYAGQRYTLDAGRSNSVELLLSTYEAAVEENRKLAAAREKLERQSEELRDALARANESHEQLKKTQIDLIQAERLQTVGRLAASIAHEVKNPLAVLKIGIELLGSSGDSASEETSLVLGEMKDAVDRAGLVIGDLLALSSPRPLELNTESINELIEKAVRFVKHDLTHAKVSVTRGLANDLPLCCVDGNKILQVLINLIINACHAMPGGGVLAISTSKKVIDSGDGGFDAGDTVVFVELKDTGTGIPEEYIAKIFTPFFTTKPAGEGTGLGLPVVKQIMELHGGSVSIANSREGGAMVTLALRSMAAPKTTARV